MKIFIPFARRDIGGTSIFASKFKAGMEKHGHEVFFEYREDYDVLFLIVQGPFRYLLDAKKRGKKIVQRLDGTYYWSVASWKFPFYNLKAMLTRWFFADFSIYQSKYSQRCVEAFLGKMNPDPSTTIFNGVDTQLFSHEGETLSLREYPDQMVFFTVSDFRRKDQILPLLQAIAQYKKLYNNRFRFVIAGQFSREVAHIPQEYAHFSNVVFLGKIANSDLPKYERGCDVFLLSHLNPPCPNNVLEALACGLPICGVGDGAMPEIVEHGQTGLLLSTQGDAFWKRRQIDPTLFARQLYELTLTLPEYKRHCRENSLLRFSLERMIDEYQSALNKSLSV